MDKATGVYRKSWCGDNIFGSSRFEFSQSTRGIWNDLLDLAKLSRVKPGIIAPAPGKCYPHAYLAELLNTSLDEFETALKVLVDTERVTENHNGIMIVKWEKYQTDYDRQRPYREAKKEGKKISKVCPTCGYKVLTNEIHCPKCDKKGQVTLLEKNYTSGKYGHMVKH